MVGAAILGGALALVRGRDRALRWGGGVALFGMLAYLFTPLSASGAEGEPVGFAINIRFAIPPLLAGLALLPPGVDGPKNQPHLEKSARRRGVLLIAALLAVLLLTDRPDAVLRDLDRLFAWGSPSSSSWFRRLC